MNEPARIQNDKEEAFQFGKADRKAGRPCRFANGAYLDGWYSTEDQTHYCMKDHCQEHHRYEPECLECLDAKAASEES